MYSGLLWSGTSMIDSKCHERLNRAASHEGALIYNRKVHWMRRVKYGVWIGTESVRMENNENLKKGIPLWSWIHGAEIGKMCRSSIYSCDLEGSKDCDTSRQQQSLEWIAYLLKHF